MKIINKNQNNFLENNLNNFLACLVYGEDLGLVNQQIKKLITIFFQNIKEDISESISYIFHENYQENKNIILEESFSRSFFGSDKKIIIVKESNNTYTKSIKDYLEQGNLENILLIAQAGSLDSSSSLRKLFEKEQNLLSIPCYQDNISSLREFINNTMQQYNFSITNDALLYLSNHLGNNREITLNELEKLILYKYQEKHINIKDCQLLISDNMAINTNKFIYFLFNKDINNSYHHLDLLTEEGISNIGIIRIIINHIYRIITVKSNLENNTMENALRALKPPIFYQYKNDFEKQVHNYNINQLTNLLNFCLKTEILLKTYPNLGYLPIKQMIIRYFHK